MLKQQKAILSFWRDIEIFALPTLPADAKLFKLGSTLPWQIPHKQEENFIWQHFIYFGKLTKKGVTDLIEKATDYIPDEDDENAKEKVTGNTCIAAMIVNEHGHTSQDNGYIQASYIHGLRALQRKTDLSKIEEELDKSQELFKERFPLNEDAKTLEEMQTSVINWSHLSKEIEILNSLSIEGIIAENDIFIKSFKYSRHAKPDLAFLNSFYLKDLNNLITGKETWSKGLQKFLSINTEDIAQIDLLNNASAFWETIDPKHIPAGRWPSNPKWGLYSAQLGAVNTCLNELKDTAGIIGVNGPPGTGKTTLLSDIIAEVIVKRATTLLKSNLGSMFGKGEKLDREDNFFFHYAPDSKIFKDSGIVVASNNNSAVENISKELPSSKKIDLESFPDAGYFTEVATEVFDQDSWGILAVALGNSENKNAFKNKFWPKGDQSKGFLQLLIRAYDKNNDQTESYTVLYNETKARLKGLLNEFENFQNKAAHYHSLLPEFFKDQALQISEKEILSGLKSKINLINNEKENLESLIISINARISSLNGSVKTHHSTKPSWFLIQQIFKTSSYKLWKETETLYLSEIASQTKKLIESQRSLDSSAEKLEKLEKEASRTNKRLIAISARLSAYQQLKEELHKEYGIGLNNIPDEHLFKHYSTDKISFHKANPWSSVQINTLRSDIFLQSLKLHEYAILSNAKPFRNNLNLFMEYLDGRVTIDAKTAENLWKTFFFCIPVVSTTLASVSKLFGPLSKESIGWLLIDEAGQATPLSSAGIINRAKRSIIIGDPLQIEPVVTINKKLVKMLRTQRQADTMWSPLRNSTQTLTDRVTGKGAWLTSSNGEQTWTGFPLRTHRRCNNPMFDIANAIAYDKQMVKAEPDAEFDCPLGESAWFDVQGTTVENKHIITEEMVHLKEKITLLGKDADIFVISPFKAVAERCTATFEKFPNVKCGTIHTFQGKEADIVFLVLGSDPDVPGARGWASQKPNMLNVAITRAKKRLYVIGNKKLWKNFNYFSTLAKEL